MNLREKTEHLVYTHKIQPRKRLGQNFMVSRHFLELIVSHARIRQSEVVLEVGAGFGFLTRLLARESRRVIAIEADPRIFKVLQSELSDLENVDLIMGNAIRIALPRFDKVVSNPPFSISSPLLFWLLTKPFHSAVLTFQMEFAKRLVAPVGSKDYSRITISTQYRSEIELLDPVSKDAFYPSPSMEAAIVRLKPRESPAIYVKDEEVLSEVVRTLFTQRNKKVRSAIQPLLHRMGLRGESVRKKVDTLPFRDMRVRKLTLEDFGALANELSK